MNKTHKPIPKPARGEPMQRGELLKWFEAAVARARAEGFEVRLDNPFWEKILPPLENKKQRLGKPK